MARKLKDGRGRSSAANLRPVKRRDEEQLRRVYREQLRAVYAFHAYRVPQAVAEDLTQATFERVVRHWSRFDPAVASERTWVLAIARNVQIDHFRRQAHRKAVSTDEHPALLDALTETRDPLAVALSHEGLVGWLGQLGEREREVVALRFGADLSAREVAEMTGLSEANVHQVASRALRKLRKAADSTQAADARAEGT